MKENTEDEMLCLPGLNGGYYDIKVKAISSFKAANFGNETGSIIIVKNIEDQFPREYSVLLSPEGIEHLINNPPMPRQQ